MIDLLGFWYQFVQVILFWVTIRVLIVNSFDEIKCKGSGTCNPNNQTPIEAIWGGYRNRNGYFNGSLGDLRGVITDYLAGECCTKFHKCFRKF